MNARQLNQRCRTKCKIHSLELNSLKVHRRKRNKSGSATTQMKIVITINATWNQAVFSPLIDFCEFLGTAIILALGAYFVIKKDLTIGQLVAYLSYVALLQSPIQSFTRLLNQLQQSLVSYGRITDILKVKPQITTDSAAVTFPQFSNQISFEHVNFTYPAKSSNAKNLVAISDVSFDIPYGQTVALVGHSGAGKSTVVKLLDRLYDADSGVISFDGIPINDIDLTSFAKISPSFLKTSI